MTHTGPHKLVSWIFPQRWICISPIPPLVFWIPAKMTAHQCHRTNKHTSIQTPNVSVVKTLVKAVGTKGSALD